MKSHIIFSTILILCLNEQFLGRTLCYGGQQFDVSMSNLGSLINEQIQNQITSINSKVNEQVYDINTNIHQQMNDFSQNLANRMYSMSQNLDQQIRDLNSQIQTNVQNSLKPVQAMMIVSAMANGVGGVTIANYGDRYTLMILNGNKYLCPGSMQVQQGSDIKCSEKLIPDTNDNICTEGSYSRLNNIYCFGNQAELNCLDYSCQCKNGKMYTINALKSLCGPTYGTDSYVHYTYYPNMKDANHIIIPNPNENVKCANPHTGTCTWSGNGFVVPIKDM